MTLQSDKLMIPLNSYRPCRNNTWQTHTNTNAGTCTHRYANIWNDYLKKSKDCWLFFWFEFDASTHLSGYLARQLKMSIGDQGKTPSAWYWKHQFRCSLSSMWLNHTRTHKGIKQRKYGPVEDVYLSNIINLLISLPRNPKRASARKLVKWPKPG
jgi:hypothetical protein